MEGKKQVIDGVFPISTTKCVFVDGTGETLHDYLKKDNSTNKYTGKNFLWLGDSISSGLAGYPTLIKDYFNANLNNLASSGGDAVRMRDICQGLGEYQGKKPDYSKIDYVFIMIGHNCDGTNGVANSTLEKIPTDSTPFTEYPNGFHCDVASCIEFIWNEKPEIEIFLITPIQSTNGRYAATTPLAQKALKEIGNMYAIPVIDIYSISGICKRNIHTYTSDEIHPNDLGKMKIADKIIHQILSF